MGIITKEYPLQCWGGLNKNAQVNSFQTYSLPSSLLVNVRMTLPHKKYAQNVEEIHMRQRSQSSVAVVLQLP